MPGSQYFPLPAAPTTTTPAVVGNAFFAANQAEMLNSNAKDNDTCFRTDTNPVTIYTLTDLPANTLANWRMHPAPSAAVPAPSATATAPVSPVANQMWTNTSTATVAGVPAGGTGVWNGSAWRVLNNGNTQIIVGSYTTNPTAPDGAKLFDQANRNSYLRIGGAWVRTSLAAGVVMYDYVTTPPAGYLKVNPFLLHSQAAYPELAARLGIPAGGNWSFVDARGEFLRVWDDGRGVDNGRIARSSQEATATAQKMTDWTGLSTNGANGGIGQAFAYPDSEVSWMNLNFAGLVPVKNANGSTLTTAVSDGLMRAQINDFGDPSEQGRWITHRPRNLAFPLIIKI